MERLAQTHYSNASLRTILETREEEEEEALQPVEHGAPLPSTIEFAIAQCKNALRMPPIPPNARLNLSRNYFLLEVEEVIRHGELGLIQKLINRGRLSDTELKLIIDHIKMSKFQHAAPSFFPEGACLFVLANCIRDIPLDNHTGSLFQPFTSDLQHVFQSLIENCQALDESVEEHPLISPMFKSIDGDPIELHSRGLCFTLKPDRQISEDNICSLSFCVSGTSKHVPLWGKILEGKNFPFPIPESNRILLYAAMLPIYILCQNNTPPTADLLDRLNIATLVLMYHFILSSGEDFHRKYPGAKADRREYTISLNRIFSKEISDAIEARHYKRAQSVIPNSAGYQEAMCRWFEENIDDNFCRTEGSTKARRSDTLFTLTHYIQIFQKSTEQPHYIRAAMSGPLYRLLFNSLEQLGSSTPLKNRSDDPIPTLIWTENSPHPFLWIKGKYFGAKATSANSEEGLPYSNISYDVEMSKEGAPPHPIESLDTSFIFPIEAENDFLKIAALLPLIHCSVEEDFTEPAFLRNSIYSILFIQSVLLSLYEEYKIESPLVEKKIRDLEEASRHCLEIMNQRYIDSVQKPTY